MNSRKIMSKKLLCLTLITLMLISALSACGIFSERDPIELQTFLSVMEENGFEIIDYTNQTTGEVRELTSLYLIAVSPGASYQIEFLELHTAESARAIFEGTKQNAENLRSGSGSHSSVNGPNHNSHSLTAGGLYSRLLRVDDIVVFVLGADADYRDDIRAKFDLFS